MAVMYSLLAGSIASANGDEDDARKTVHAAGELYRMAARLFDRSLDEKDELGRVTTAVQQLLSEWCCAFLYPGPCCEGEPHGVVIGCAVVCGGEIERIDPWGGRRWVMHYPLLSYWGEQFGIVPPDLLASRIFALICCLARLERPSCEPFYKPEARAGRMEMQCGGVTFGIGESPHQSGNTGHRRPISRRETVSLLEFAAHALAAIAQPQVAEEVSLREVRLEGNSDIYILIPDHLPASAPTGVAEQRSDDQLTLLVREALAVPRIRRVHRRTPLFRAFHEKLSVGLAASVPLSVLDPPPSHELAEKLGGAGIDTVGMILRQPPEILAGDIGDGITAAAVNDLILHAEAKVAAVTADTVEIVQSVANEYSLVSAVDYLGLGEAFSKLVETLATRLELPGATVEAQLSAALA